MFESDGADAGADSVVYDLADAASVEDLEQDTPYLARVNGVVEYGVFVDVTDSLSGLVHESDLLAVYDVGDELVVELESVRENGDLAFEEVAVEPEAVRAAGERAPVDVAAVAEQAGSDVVIEGVVQGVKQTGGPTVFQVGDGTGVVPCAAFESAGVRAYPDVDRDDVVGVGGRVESRDGGHQLEVTELTMLEGDDAASVRGDVRAALASAAEPADVDPLVEWDALEDMWADLRDVATRLRRSVLSGRPIKMRHHADGDGICAGVPLQHALERFVAEHFADPKAPRHAVTRLPSKAPFYELEDVTRDLNYALENRERHGGQLPLLLMLDNGSTEEDVPAYRTLSNYDVPILVVDHHHPDPEAVEPFVDAHVNPYLHGEDYRVTTGMLSVELARMIDPAITDELGHVPAVAGLADRSSADAMADYVGLARAEGYEVADLRDVGEALDYATHWLKYDDGRSLIDDALNVDCEDGARHEAVVDFLAERAERDVEIQLDAALPHVDQDDLPSGAQLYRIDVENHAHRFTYPAPGTTTGEIHDAKVEETGDPVITIGYGPDFAVLRSDGVRLDIPEMVEELDAEIVGGGVSGGGHLVVGSIKFLKGRREDVIDALVEKMADAEIDEELGSSPALPGEV